MKSLWVGGCTNSGSMSCTAHNMGNKNRGFTQWNNNLCFFDVIELRKLSKLFLLKFLSQIIFILKFKTKC